MSRWSVLMMALGAFPVATATARQEYTVIAGDYSSIGGSAVEKAARLAEGILETAGVHTRLVVCPVTSSHGIFVANCPETGQLPDAFVKIVKHNASYGKVRAAMGLAMPGRNSTQPNIAYVFYEYVRQVSESGHCELYEVLGHVLAHEIGHLLGSQHSASGIMRPAWKKATIAEMSRGRLAFSAEQAEIMRGNAERRAGRRALH